MAAFYFVMWLFVGRFILKNLFAATVVNNFARARESESEYGVCILHLLT